MTLSETAASNRSPLGQATTQGAVGGRPAPMAPPHMLGDPPGMAPPGFDLVAGSAGAPEAPDPGLRSGPGDWENGAWRDRAACRATAAELFFPTGRAPGASEQVRQAKSVCWSCEVREACLRYALETNQDAGIWGGTSEDERRKLRRAWMARRRRLRPAIT